MYPIVLRKQIQLEIFADKANYILFGIKRSPSGIIRIEEKFP